ncbi:hypothetical protein VTK56DRAFT_898 [Thermocarpiscus australiensis]
MASPQKEIGLSQQAGPAPSDTSSRSGTIEETRFSRPPTTTTTTTTAADRPRPDFGLYTPGSGPPPPPISLLPPTNKTTGYIIDKFMIPRRLPGPLPHKVQVIAVYYVGYTDRPSARALVPYFEILGHVSPRELEDWELKLREVMAEEKEEELAGKGRTRTRSPRQKEPDKGAAKRVTRAMGRRMSAELEEGL